MDDFIAGEYELSDGEADYDPRVDKNKRKTKTNNQQKKQKKNDVGLRLSDNQESDESDDLFEDKTIYGDENDEDDDDDDNDNDSDDDYKNVKSANDEIRKQTKLRMKKQENKKRITTDPPINRKRKNDIDYFSKHPPNKKQRTISRKNSDSGLSSHLNEMMRFDYNYDKSNRINPNGLNYPPSKISNFKKAVSKPLKRGKRGRASKLNKLKQDHRNSILAGNIAAANNSVTFRKNDKSKTGKFKKRNGGAVILKPGEKRNIQNKFVSNSINNSNNNNIPKKIPKKISNPKPMIKPNTKIKQKQSQSFNHNNHNKNNNINNNINNNNNYNHKRNQRKDNSLFKQMNKRNHNNHNSNNHNSNNYNRGRFNKMNNCGRGKRDCQIELFCKVLKWKANDVESALTDTVDDLAPMGDKYQNINEYKQLIEPFLLEETRAKIAQIIQEKKVKRLIRRQPNDPSTNPNRNKNNKSYSNRNNQNIYYDVARITSYQPHANNKIATITFEPINGYTRWDKTFFKDDLVLLVQDNDLTNKNPSNAAKIDDILKYGILGAVRQTFNQRDPLSIYINPQNTSYRINGNLCAIIQLESFTTTCREYRVIATMDQNTWSEKILQPKKIYPVNGMLLLDIRDKKLPQWIRNKLNDCQLSAVAASLCRDNHITLIKGPPGTGKTTTIVSLINAALLNIGYLSGTQRPKILVCAPSNAAIDEVVKRSFNNMLTRDGNQKLRVEMIRIGSGVTRNSVGWKIHIDRVSAPDHDLRELQKKLRNLEEESKKVRAKWCQTKRDNMRAGPSATQENKDKAKHLGDKLRKMQVTKGEYETKIKNEEEKQKSNQNNFKRIDKTALIREHDVIFSTLSASASTYLNGINFDLLIIDESTQSCEISSLIPFQLNVRSIVLVGDEKQLPATVISNSCQIFGYDKSFFERCIENGVEPYLLDIQYRMHPDIREWPSVTFYDNKLKDGSNIQRDIEPFGKSHGKDPRLGPYAFFDVYHGREEFIQNGKTYVNPTELDFILRLLDFMSFKFYERKEQKKWDNNVGIVTPYRGQVNALRKAIQKHQNEKMKSIVVDTVESFQGQEKNIIIFSCVRAQRQTSEKKNIKGNLGFLTDLRRLNVALTRAKYCCIIVGHSQTLRADKTWQQLIWDAHNRGFLYSVNTPKNKEYLHRDPDKFISTFDAEKIKAKQKQQKQKSVTPGGPTNNNNDNDDVKSKSDRMDIDSNSRSRSRSSSSSHHREESKHRNHHHNHHHHHHNRHNSDNRDNKQRKKHLSDAEIARLLKLPEIPTDPRRRRR